MKNYILILITLFFFQSCDNVDFEDTVINPNEPSQVLSNALLAAGQLSAVPIYSATRPSLYVQYVSNEQYNDESLYKTQRFDYSSYYGNITNLNKVIEANTNESSKVSSQAYGSNNNQIAVAKLMKAYYFHFMTDNWGMIPYKTANDITVDFNKFDSQEEIYNLLFLEIEAAISLIDSGDGPKGDIILKGDMDMWKKFGYSLMMNMAVRLSKKAPATGKTYFTKAMTGGVISSNSENIYFPFLKDDNYDNPWQDRFQTRSDYLLSKPFVNSLIGTGSNTNPEDPRLEKYAEKATATNTYNGALYGESNSDTKAFSFITNEVIKNSEAKGYIFTYAQMLLNMAEAAHLNWTTADTSENYYKKGIKASMEQWGVDTTAADAYVMSRPAFNGLKSIAYQKWVALFLQGYEAWFDWRKHGVNQVKLTKPVAATTAGIPNRQAYPLSAISSNKKNYDEAVSLQGKDDLDTKVWWHKN